MILHCSSLVLTAESRCRLSVYNYDGEDNIETTEDERTQETLSYSGAHSCSKPLTCSAATLADEVESFIITATSSVDQWEPFSTLIKLTIPYRFKYSLTQFFMPFAYSLCSAFYANPASTKINSTNLLTTSTPVC